MEKHIYDKATDLTELYNDFYNDLESIRICKVNESTWDKESIELATDYMPEYLLFKIGLDGEQEDDSTKILTGYITEIWFWDEEYCPTPIVYPDLSEWKIGTRVTIDFNDSDDESDGEMKKAEW